MKYGIVISTSKTKFGPIVFKENLNDNIIKVTAMGYEGVELAIRKPEAIKLDQIDKLIKKNNLKVIAIGTGQIYSEEGLNFSDVDKTVIDKALERTKKIIDIAEHFGAFIIIGLIRGSIRDINNYSHELAKAEKRIALCLEKLLSYSESKSIEFLLEPVNRYEVNIFNNLEDINNFLTKYKDRLDLKRIGILADTFHMNIEEPIIEESFKKYSKLIKHIHFADSNRWPPGYGHIDFGKIVRQLKANDYNGFIVFEMFPFPDPDTAAEKAINYIRKIEKNF